jgi:putative transposon-encoded protein
MMYYGNMVWKKSEPGAESTTDSGFLTPSRAKKGRYPVKDEEKDLSASEDMPKKVKFEIFGEEMLEKIVKMSGNSGRVYLPPEWVGKHVKIIRTD